MNDKVLQEIQQIKRLANHLAERLEELELLAQPQIQTEGGTRKPPPPPEGGGN